MHISRILGKHCGNKKMKSFFKCKVDVREINSILGYISRMIDSRKEVRTEKLIWG